MQAGLARLPVPCWPGALKRRAPTSPLTPTGELTDDEGGLRRFSSSGSGAEPAHEGGPAVTASSLRMVRWMRDYAGLMR